MKWPWLNVVTIGTRCYDDGYWTRLAGVLHSGAGIGVTVAIAGQTTMTYDSERCSATSSSVGVSRVLEVRAVDSLDRCHSPGSTSTLPLVTNRAVLDTCLRRLIVDVRRVYVVVSSRGSVTASVDTRSVAPTRASTVNF